MSKSHCIQSKICLQFNRKKLELIKMIFRQNKSKICINLLFDFYTVIMSIHTSSRRYVHVLANYIII